MDYSLITPELKDRILKELVNDLGVNRTCNANTNDVLSAFNIDFDTFRVIIDCYADDGFCDYPPNIRRQNSILRMLPACVDFLQSGGYTQQAQTQQLEKRKLELDVTLIESQLEAIRQEAEKIRPVNNTIAERIIASVSAIASATCTAIALGK